MCDIRIEQSKWPTWQVREHKQKKIPRGDRAEKRERGKRLRKDTNMEKNQRKYPKEQDEQSVVPSLWKNTRKNGVMPEARSR